MGIDLTLQGAQFCLICHLTQLLSAGNLQLSRDDLRQSNGHLLQGRGYLVCVTIIDFQGACNDAFLPQRDHQHRVDLGRTIGLIIVFDDDFTVINGLASCWADGIIIVAIIMFAHADIRQHVVDVGDGNCIGVNIATNNIANLSQGFGVHMAEQRQGFIGNI
ncbi:hypothetical protein D3C76_1219980 [compost metagenome]